jgi:hypothetical protein
MDVEDLNEAQKTRLYAQVNEMVRREVSERLRKMDFTMQLAKLRLEPDEVLVLRTDLFLDPDQAQELRKRFDENIERMFPGQNIRSLVLTGNMRLTVGQEVPLDWEPAPY